MSTSGWGKVIEDIEREGVTAYKIAQCLGKHPRRVRAIKAGSEPKHSEGEILLALRRSLCGQKGHTSATPDVDEALHSAASEPAAARD